RLDTDALVSREAIQNVDQVKSLSAFRIIYSGQINQVIEILLQFQELQNRDHRGGLRDQETLAEIRGEFGDLVAELPLEAACELPFPWCCGHGRGRFGSGMCGRGGGFGSGCGRLGGRWFRAFCGLVRLRWGAFRLWLVRHRYRVKKTTSIIRAIAL